MNILLLLPNEAKLVEGLKAKKDISTIAEELDMNIDTMYHMLKRLVNYGILERTGRKRYYVFSVTNVPYEMVEKRGRSIWKEKPEIDPKLLNLSDTRFTPKQQAHFQKYKDVDRRILARQLGMTKTQLNFAILNEEETHRQHAGS
ncbi:hypothetical protein ACHHV8_33595 [Paenibacillus sp. TAB 01]|uniref:hypothetical protein n=1 Tax=Paenibacillus sp. TAB 01 TaxID=3368988 RepID=UPI003750DCCD